MKQTVEFPPVWKRFTAMTYDTLLILALSMGYGGFVLAIQQFIFKQEEPIVSGLLFQLGWVAIVIAFFCFFWMRAGQTLGMRTWRLKVVNQTDLKPLSLFQCIGRCVLAPVGLALFFIAIIRKDKQCLHDTLTHSTVILLPKNK